MLPSFWKVDFGNSVNGTMVVERSIAVNEPVLYVAMNHRVSGEEPVFVSTHLSSNPERSIWVFG